MQSGAPDAVYQGLSKKRLCEEYVEEKLNSAPGS